MQGLAGQFQAAIGNIVDSLSSAQSLSRQSTQLRTEVEKFLQTVRAA